MQVLALSRRFILNTMMLLVMGTIAAGIIYYLMKIPTTPRPEVAELIRGVLIIFRSSLIAAQDDISQIMNLGFTFLGLAAAAATFIQYFTGAKDPEQETRYSDSIKKINHSDIGAKVSKFIYDVSTNATGGIIAAIIIFLVFGKRD